MYHEAMKKEKKEEKKNAEIHLVTYPWPDIKDRF